MSNLDKWCPLPWSHIAVKSNGHLRLCSHSQSGGNKKTVLTQNEKILTIDDLKFDISNCETLKEVRAKFLNNEWPEQCRRCRIESEAGKRSRNQWESTMYDFTKEDARAITAPDGTVSEYRILSLDLRLGNKCNVQCVMCYPGESNQWYKIQEKVTGKRIFSIDDVSYSIDDTKVFDWANQKEYYELVAKHSMFVKKIKFGGGEPFLVKEHVALLEALISNGFANDIELEYSINVTVLPDYIFNLFSNFKIVKLCASVDGTADVNHAIRYPTPWKVVEKNLDILDSTPANITVFTSTTVSILNLENIVDWMLWLKNKNFKKINKDTFAGVVSHPVMNPKYLNIGLLSEDQRNRMFVYLRSKTTDTEILSKLNQWELYANKMPITVDEIIQGRKDLKDFFFKMSSLQNINWKEVFPKCYEMMLEWKE
jgi:organic radical activating enzyme